MRDRLTATLSYILSIACAIAVFVPIIRGDKMDIDIGILSAIGFIALNMGRLFWGSDK